MEHKSNKIQQSESEFGTGVNLFAVKDLESRVDNRKSSGQSGSNFESPERKMSDDYQTKLQICDNMEEVPIIQGQNSPGNGPRAVYYIIDAATMMSGKAQISITDKSADPGALGLLGFGLTTFLLNLANAGVFPMDSMVMAMGLCYGGSA